jgi:hypothetical protein
MQIDFDKLTGGDSMDATLPNKAAKYSYLSEVQSEVLDAWIARRDESDSVSKMNTGEGKAVVSLLILQSRLNDKKWPVVHVCVRPFPLRPGLFGLFLPWFKRKVASQSIQSLPCKRNGDFPGPENGKNTFTGWVLVG